MKSDKVKSDKVKSDKVKSDKVKTTLRDYGLLGPSEVCELKGFSRQRYTQLIESYGLRTIRAGTMHLLPVEELDRLDEIRAFEPPPGVLTTQQAAEYLGCGVENVRRYVQIGRIRVYDRHFGHLYFAVKDLDEFQMRRRPRGRPRREDRS